MNSSDIKQVRKKLKLSQKEFGKALGVSLSAVQSWESGARNMSDTAIKLLNGLLNDPSIEQHNVSVSNLSLVHNLSIFYNKDGERVPDKAISEYATRNIERFIREDIGFKKSIDIEALKILMKARKSDGTIDIDKIGD
ncbi:helix-turn-helix domain-containing protein [Aquimarina algiphila]|uniref:Helix-turn-helix domain-containing protein n=1 Tax=Aquimarina algiphila TaxID=2047982 RepID=A0A554VA74_9FLAO|nr:helix-turn-helix domain-containing protein [Aquimarina algiphila]TSE02655.1 helix-turn-helix domain-containing protein [Aquimarina algiphila]